jgi:hypothetical protein
MTFHVSVKDQKHMGLGTFEDVIVIAACKDYECKEHIEGSPQQVSVRYLVRSVWTAQPEEVSITHVLGGGTTGPKGVAIQNPLSLEWTAQADKDWIRLSPTSSTWLGVEIDSSSLDFGNHEGSITVLFPTDNYRIVVPVRFQFMPMSITPNQLVFGGEDGQDLQDQELILQLINIGNTPTRSQAWSATVDVGNGPQWLRISPTSGTLSSSTPSNRLIARVDPTGLGSGTHTGSVKFTVLEEGRPMTYTLPVSLKLVEHKLWVPDNGVSLVSTPSTSKLTHTVKVKDRTGQLPARWTASTNQLWLSVTLNGGDTLTMTANPAGLAPDTLHLATVTLSPVEASMEREHLQVGLWVGSRPSNSRDTLTAPYQDIETDPVRPYVYAHNGTDLFVFNVYTAELVTRLMGLGLLLGEMSISTDGSTLYVLSESRRVIPVNLATMTRGTPWSLENSTMDLAYVRPNGHGLIVTGSGGIYSGIHDAATGARIPQVPGQSRFYGFLRTNKEGTTLCQEGGPLACFHLRYTDRQSGSVFLSPRGAVYRRPTDVAINSEGTRVYSAPSESSGFSVAVHDGWMMEQTATWAYDAQPSALAIGPDEQLFVAISDRSGSTDVRVHDEAGTILGTYRAAPPGSAIRSRQLKLSGDGKRLVTLSDGPTLDLLSVP